ncbi:MAG: 3TM-type holin [Roseobacter sp.]
MLPLISAILPTLNSVIARVAPDKDAEQKIKAELLAAIIDSENDFNKAAAQIITAEAQGESWLQRNWRPMLMIWFAVLVGAYWFGMTPPNLSEDRIGDLFQLVQIGVGGYIVGRSGEKIAKQLKP